MEAADWRGELDVNFRYNVLNNGVVDALMKEWGRNSQNPNILQKINDIAMKFEQRIFEKATSKDDYVAKIHQKITQLKSKHGDVLTTPSTGNQLTSTMVQRQVVHPYHAQQNFNGIFLPPDKRSMLPIQPDSSSKPMAGSLTSMQQRNMGTQPALNGFRQDWQMGQQSTPFQNEFQSSYQQSMPIREPFGTAHNMLNMDSSKWLADVSNQTANCHALQMPHLGSSSRLSYTLVDSAERRDQLQDISRFRGSEIPAIPQSKMVATKPPGAFSSLAESKGSDIVDWNVLITQFQRMRLVYLPELVKWLEKADVQCAHAQSIEHFQKSQRAKVVLGRMITFLHMTEHDIMVHPKEKLINCMNQIIQFVRTTPKSNTASTGNHALQCSLSHSQMGGLSSPMSMDPGIPYEQPSGVMRISCNTIQQMDIQSQLNHSHLKLKKNLQRGQSSSTNQAPLEMLVSGKSSPSPRKQDDFLMFNPTSMVPQQNFSRGQFSGGSLNSLLSFVPPEGRPLPMKVSQPSSVHMDQENDTTSFLFSRENSQPKTPICTVGSPSTQPPSSVSKEIEKPVQSVCLASSASKKEIPQDSGEISSTEDEIDVQAKIIITPGLSSGVSKQLSHVAKPPVERLVELVQSMSREALSNSIDDIASVINILDRLSDVDLENFPSYSSQEIECNIDGQTPVKKVKREIISTCRNASMILDDHDPDTMQLKRSKLESNHGLLAEIRRTNQKLVETVIELASESMEDPAAPGATKGTIVRCTCKPVSLSESFKRYFASSIPVATISIEFLVPSDYPKSSPQCLDSLTEECSFSKDAKDLTEKAKLRFNHCVRGLQEPMSLVEMARAWDDCARSVLSEFARCVGGESFISKYGSWECVPAA